MHCFHALALDERRSNFVPTRLGPRAYEVWFRGNHSDVGGGNANLGLNNISLRWMLRKALKTGLPVTEAQFPADADLNPDAELNEPTDPIKTGLRHVLPDDCVHFSVHLRPGDRFNKPADTCRHELAEHEGTRLDFDQA